MSYALFQKVDVDKSGSISAAEMKDFIAAMIHEERTRAKRGSVVRRQGSVRKGRGMPTGGAGGGAGQVTMRKKQEKHPTSPSRSGVVGGGAALVTAAGDTVGIDGGIQQRLNEMQVRQEMGSKMKRMSVMDGELSMGYVQAKLRVEFNGVAGRGNGVAGGGEEAQMLSIRCSRCSRLLLSVSADACSSLVTSSHTARSVDFNGEIFYFYDIDGDGEMSRADAQLQGEHACGCLRVSACTCARVAI